MRCAACRGRMDGERCTDCACAYIVQVRNECQWDHSVLLLALTLKEKHDGARSH